MVKLAEQMKAAAIQWKITNAQAEKADAIAKINTLGGFAWDVVNSYGGSVLEVLNSGDHAPYYRAIVTRHGKKHLESLGFQIDVRTDRVNIWWADPIEIEAEVDAIVNPPKPEPIP